MQEKKFSGEDLFWLLLWLIPLDILRGRVIADLWLWFVVPAFKAPVIAWPLWAGIVVLKGLIAPIKTDTEIKSASDAITPALIQCLGSWGVGWLIFRLFVV